MSMSGIHEPVAICSYSTLGNRYSETESLKVLTFYCFKCSYVSSDSCCRMIGEVNVFDNMLRWLLARG